MQPQIIAQLTRHALMMPLFSIVNAIWAMRKMRNLVIFAMVGFISFIFPRKFER